MHQENKTLTSLTEEYVRQHLELVDPARIRPFDKFLSAISMPTHSLKRRHKRLDQLLPHLDTLQLAVRRTAATVLQEAQYLKGLAVAENEKAIGKLARDREELAIIKHVAENLIHEFEDTIRIAQKHIQLPQNIINWRNYNFPHDPNTADIVMHTSRWNKLKATLTDWAIKEHEINETQKVMTDSSIVEQVCESLESRFKGELRLIEPRFRNIKMLIRAKKLDEFIQILNQSSTEAPSVQTLPNLIPPEWEEVTSHLT